MRPRISAVVCTHNRAPYLRKCLESLAAQSLDPTHFEIVVVDNASTDDSAHVAEVEFRHLPNLRYVHEPVVGISRARNTGWLEARGEIIACLDDDAIADADWLQAVLAFFDEGHERVGAVGGRIDPIWEAPRPPWLSDELAPSLTILSWPGDVRPIHPGEWIVAANIAFPKAVLETIGGFQTGLGRRGDRLLSNEENLARLAIEERGLLCYWDPRIAVRHHVHATRLTREWLRRRSWWQGVSDAVMRQYRRPVSRATRLWRGGRALGRLCVSPRGVWSLVSPSRAPEAFHASCLAWYRVGYGMGLLGLVARGPLRAESSVTTVITAPGDLP